MTSGSESQQEAVAARLGALNTKTKTRLGFWNVRTMFTEQEDMSIVLTRKRWSCVGHVLRRESTSISKVALRWTPEGKRKRGRPNSSWRRTAEAELQALNLTWGQASWLAKYRQEWRRLVDALCATRRLKD